MACKNRRDEQARKHGDIARAGVEQLAGFRQRAAEDGLKSMDSGLDAASQGFQNASNQFTRTLGFSGEEGERLARQSGQNVEAITKFGTVLTQACQDTSREWYGLAQKQLQRNLEGLSHPHTAGRCRISRPSRADFSERASSTWSRTPARSWRSRSKR